MRGEHKTYFGHRERLRQKFKGSSLSGFHEYEILELLLTYSIPRVDVKPYAKALLEKFGSIRGVLDAPRPEVSRVPGVGDNASILIAMLKELTGALIKEDVNHGKALNAPEDVASYVAGRIGPDNGESLYALYLNSKNHAIGLETICDGRPDIVDLSPRLILEKALKNNARSIIFIHNALTLTAAEDTPSQPIALALRSFASTIDVLVHDYIVLTGGSLLSARNEGWFKG